MRLIYHPAAEADLIEAARFYERRVPGLGREFLNEFEGAIAKISEAPDRWPVIEADIRRHLMTRFPYGIYYRLAGDELRVLVVKHHRRHPGYWKSRR